MHFSAEIRDEHAADPAGDQRLDKPLQHTAGDRARPGDRFQQRRHTGHHGRGRRADAQDGDQVLAQFAQQLDRRVDVHILAVDAGQVDDHLRGDRAPGGQVDQRKGTEGRRAGRAPGMPFDDLPGPPVQRLAHLPPRFLDQPARLQQ